MEQITKMQSPFNSPLECGLRSLVLLEAAYPLQLDMQRLVFYDYLLVHSADAGGPESIHPATPLRSGELLVKRNMLEQGLFLMMSRNLIERNFTNMGIVYQASDNAAPFLDSLIAQYTSRLKGSAKWVLQEFSNFTDVELDTFFSKHFDKWGGEFEREAILKYVTL